MMPNMAEGLSAPVPASEELGLQGTVQMFTQSPVKIHRNPALRGYFGAVKVTAWGLPAQPVALKGTVVLNKAFWLTLQGPGTLHWAF